MTGRHLTRILAAVAAVLTAALTVVLTQWPRPGDSPVGDDPVAVEPATVAASTQTSTSSPGASPSTAVTDPAAEGGPDPLPSSPLPSSEVAAGDASPGATAHSQTDDARRQWQPAATGFGRHFTATRGKSAAQWRADLTPYVTGTVADHLGTVDLDQVPAGTFTDYEVAEYGEDQIAVYLHYDTDLTLVAYLIDDGTRWRLYAYDRWED